MEREERERETGCRERLGEVLVQDRCFDCFALCFDLSLLLSIVERSGYFKVKMTYKCN